jgi:hypothetical protein
MDYRIRWDGETLAHVCEIKVPRCPGRTRSEHLNMVVARDSSFIFIRASYTNVSKREHH